MNPEMTSLIEQRLKTLQIIIMVAIMSLVTYVGIAFMLIRQEAIESTAIPSNLLPILAGFAVSTLFTASLIVKGMIAKARRIMPPTDRLGPYQAAMIVGVALRESAGVIGLVLTLLTGNLLWVSLLSALAAFAILSNFPTRSALENLVQDAPSIG
jgi:F0F1-type ATP synthase membrane subunit c/vacuolar-type H+-ATPase subunit K